MGGHDKGLTLYREKAMAAWVSDALSTSVDKVWINCNRHLKDYRLLSPYLCSDSDALFNGPLAGLLSLLNASSADYLITSPCDTPKLQPAYALRMRNCLLKALDTKPADPLLVARSRNRQHPLHLCLSRRHRQGLAERIEQGELRVMAWLKAQQITWVDFTDECDQFDNFNAPHSLES